ncbi:hypothetical protein VZT92_009744 [Zoarces viviparus]|uniref:Uncharacterized protein n=1 Tax=Zoarces viviparus TaxID=48416 RepID=A0AAW1FCF7_ZOAVI
MSRGKVGSVTEVRLLQKTVTTSAVPFCSCCRRHCRLLFCCSLQSELPGSGLGPTQPASSAQGFYRCVTSV